MCGGVLIMFMGMRQSAVDSREILSRRSAGVALPRGSLISATASHQVSMVVVQQPGHPQQVSDANEVWPQVLHHTLLRARVKIELATEDGREYIELLVRYFFGGR